MKKLSAVRSCLLLMGVLAGCSAPRPPAGTAAASMPAPEFLAARRRLWTIVDSLTLNRPAMIARYGRPVPVRIATFDSQMLPGTRDSLVVLRFSSFEASYTVRADRRTFLRSITMSAPVAGLPRAASPGASRASLTALLGTPDADEAEEPEGRLLLFELFPGDHDGKNVLNVLLDGDRVRWISFVYFPEPSWP
jgi:hypothetical protein